MKLCLTSLMIMTCMVVSICSSFGQQSITIVNTAGIPPATAEVIRAYAEKELYVPVTLVNCLQLNGHYLMEIGAQAVKEKKTSNECLLVLVAPSKPSSEHYVVMTNQQVAVINVPAVSSTNLNIFTRRLQRLTLRAAASLLGIGSDPDPFCVMHDYKTLSDLDQMGMNFSPPWGEKFRQAAKARGLAVRPLYTPRQRPVLPATLPAVPSPASGKLELN
jgi:hypothetical protein